MNIICHGLVIILCIYILVAILMTFIKTHSVIFQNDTCIKPYKDYTYYTCEDINVLVDGDLYVIPKDFKTDLASIPRILWPVLPPQYTGFIAPAIFHDYLYNVDIPCTRRWCDEVLYAALISKGISHNTAIKFYLGVRMFGWIYYRKSSHV